MANPALVENISPYYNSISGTVGAVSDKLISMLVFSKEKYGLFVSITDN